MTYNMAITSSTTSLSWTRSAQLLAISATRTEYISYQTPLTDKHAQTLQISQRSGSICTNARPVRGSPYVWHIAIIAGFRFSPENPDASIFIWYCLTLFDMSVIIIVTVDALVFGMEWLLFVVYPRLLSVVQYSNSLTPPNKHLQVGFRTGPAPAPPSINRGLWLYRSIGFCLEEIWTKITIQEACATRPEYYLQKYSSLYGVLCHAVGFKNRYWLRLAPALLCYGVQAFVLRSSIVQI